MNRIDIHDQILCPPTVLYIDSHKNVRAETKSTVSTATNNHILNEASITVYNE